MGILMRILDFGIHEGAHEHTGFWYMYDRADEVPKDTKIQYAHEHVHIYVPKSSNILMSMLAREDTGLVDTMVLMSILDFSVHICMSVLICAFLLLVSHEHAHICTKIQYAHEHANVDYVVYHNRHNPVTDTREHSREHTGFLYISYERAYMDIRYFGIS